MGNKVTNVLVIVILLGGLVYGAINNVRKSDKIVEACHANVELQICE